MVDVVSDDEDGEGDEDDMRVPRGRIEAVGSVSEYQSMQLVQQMSLLKADSVREI
jgi:hypothetical protein